jgi:hypothetical protein
LAWWLAPALPRRRSLAGWSLGWWWRRHVPHVPPVAPVNGSNVAAPNLPRWSPPSSKPSLVSASCVPLWSVLPPERSWKPNRAVQPLRPSCPGPPPRQSRQRGARSLAQAAVGHPEHRRPRACAGLAATARPCVPRVPVSPGPLDQRGRVERAA